jgi:hypothetical protein
MVLGLLHLGQTHSLECVLVLALVANKHLSKSPLSRDHLISSTQLLCQDCITAPISWVLIVGTASPQPQTFTCIEPSISGSHNLHCLQVFRTHAVELQHHLLVAAKRSHIVAHIDEDL